MYLDDRTVRLQVIFLIFEVKTKKKKEM